MAKLQHAQPGPSLSALGSRPSLSARQLSALNSQVVEVHKAVEKSGPPKCPHCYRFAPCSVMFEMDDSVFTPRKKYADSRSYYSSAKVRARGIT